MSSGTTHTCIPVTDYVPPPTSSVNAKVLHSYFRLIGDGSVEEFHAFFEKLFHPNAIIYGKSKEEWKKTAVASFLKYKSIGRTPNFTIEEDSGDVVTIYLTTNMSQKRVRWDFTKDGKVTSAAIVYNTELVPIDYFAKILPIIAGANLIKYTTYLKTFASADEKEWENQFDDIYADNANVFGKSKSEAKTILRDELKAMADKGKVGFQVLFGVIKDNVNEILCRVKNSAISQNEERLRISFNNEGKVIQVDTLYN